MKKIVVCGLVWMISLSALQAQQVGLSFSYFVPRNGYFSTPISPFSLRGVGVNLGRYFALQTGASLYRMAGLNMTGLPFDSKDPLLGPNFTILVPAELVFQLRGRVVQFDIKGGGFFFYGFAQKLDNGNIDRALRTYQKWDVANSDLSFQNNPGFGPHFGAELTVYVTDQFGISFETNYLMGMASMPLKGTYVGGNLSGPLQSVAADFKDAKVDFTGLEFSIGLIFTGNSGGGKKPAARRRR
ncbi:MAG: hypothetical protein JSS79_15370 [Bacteroidetes bacterium]|nr:hypothetical protein [Bacteroidota bacterium]